MFKPKHALLTLAFAAAAMPASATDFVFLSHNGSGTICDGSHPCATMAAAMLAAGDHGEVICLDKGSYGDFQFTNSITISCGDLMWECPTCTIRINTPAGSEVVIEGLVADGLNSIGGTGSALTWNGQGALLLRRVRLGNRSSGNGLDFTPVGFTNLHITDSIFYSNSPSGGIGINIKPASGVQAFVDIDRSQFTENGSGIVADGTAGGIIQVAVRDSVVTRNANNGVFANSTGSAVTVSLDHTHVIGNGGFGVVANGAAVILNNSTVQENNTGLNASANGAIFSYGNNAINGNQPGGIGTAPTVIGLH